MNGTREMNGHITALYWSVSTIALAGVLDQIRTRLAELIAELRLRNPTGPEPTNPNAGSQRRELRHQRALGTA
ncbi:hypothetical protein ACNQUF_11850 [Corynebacterium diphtheriae]